MKGRRGIDDTLAAAHAALPGTRGAVMSKRTVPVWMRRQVWTAASYPHETFSIGVMDRPSPMFRTVTTPPTAMHALSLVGPSSLRSSV